MFQLCIVLGVFLAGLVMLLHGANSRLRSLQFAGLVFSAGVLMASLAWAVSRYSRSSPIPETRVADRPVEVQGAGYASSDTCRSCHPLEFETWAHSYHRSMTQKPSADSVVGNFDGVVLECDGRRYRLERRGNEYLVHSGSKTSRIAMTTGSHHFQAYWLAAEQSRKNPLFEFCWRVDEQRWIPVHDAFILPPENRQGVAAGRWNESCIRCHSTNGRPRIADSQSMDTQVSELGISCESCHGPAAEHVEYWRQPWRRIAHGFSKQSHDRDRGARLVNPAKLDSERSAAVCGQCHGMIVDKSPKTHQQWLAEGSAFRPGQRLERALRISTSGGDEYWPDGMVRVSGREYNGLLRSPCATHDKTAGETMSCVHCHRMHPPEADHQTLAAWADDQLAQPRDSDQSCLQCHTEFAQEQRQRSHTHHAQASTGARCLNCHMPNTCYGLLKATRSHEISSPSAITEVETGRPNACNLCHLDRTLQWTAQHLHEWYGAPEPSTLREGAGLTDDEREVASSIRWALSGDAIQRALAAWHYSWPPAREVSGSDWMLPVLAPLLNDPYHAVRFLAIRSLRLDPRATDLEYDSLGPPAQRADAAERLLATGSGLLSPTLPDRTRLDGLLTRRDDRPMSVSE